MTGDLLAQGAGDDLAEDSLPPEIETTAVPLPLTELKPWHRPRKQYVRERQWLRLSRSLLDRLEAGSENGPSNIRYLTLPGLDYLDVTLLGEVCEGLGCTLTSVSFLAATEGNPARARAQFREESLKQAGRLADNSITLPNRLEEISSPSSQAYHEIKRRAPFDIINIDACGSIALPDANHSRRLLDAIFRLVELQFSRRKTRWVLFLTTDARPNSVSPQLKQAFKDAIIANAAHGNEFRQGAHELFQVAEGGELSTALDAASESENSFLSFFSLGLSKWLLRTSNGSDWEVKALDSFYYSTMPGQNPPPSMASLAFEFIPRPTTLADEFGVINAEPVPYQAPENYSLRALVKTRSMIDLDVKMHQEPELRRELGDKTKALLVEAGYHADVLKGYEEFAGYQVEGV